MMHHKMQNNNKRIEKVSITKRKSAEQGEHDEAAERREREDTQNKLTQTEMKKRVGKERAEKERAQKRHTKMKEEA
jgi:hypothetical protein